MTNYPGGLDAAPQDFTDWTGDPALAPATAVLTSTHVDLLFSALVAIETELGIDPAGASASVAARLAAIEAALSGASVADGSITTAKLADLAVTAAKLADAAVTTAKLQDGSVTAAKVAGDVATQAELDAVAASLTALAAALPSTYAPLASPALTGNPTAPTPSPGDNDTSIATTAFVATAVAAGGSLTPTATKTSAYTAAVGELVFADVTAGGFTVTLPSNPAVGARVGVKNVTASSTNTLTTAASGGGLIDGDATATTNVPKYGGGEFQHIGSNNWKVVAVYTSSGPAGPQGPTGATGATGATGPAGTSMASVVPVAGEYLYPQGVGSVTGNGYQQYQQIQLCPIYVNGSVTVTSINCYVDTAVVGSEVRLGIYNSDPTTFRPTTRLIDGGSASSATTGQKSVTVSQALSPGLYYLAVACITVTGAKLRAVSAYTPVFGTVMTAAGSQAPGSFQWNGPAGGNTGALGASPAFTCTNSFSQTGPVLLWIGV